MPTSSPSRTSRAKLFTKIQGAPATQHGCRLLNLPPELRNRIYHFALQDDISYILRETVKRKRLHTIKPTAPGLVLTCRQTHAEAIRMLYRQAHFTFDTADLLNKWTKKIGFQRLQLVKVLRIKSPAPTLAVMMKAYWKPRAALTEFATDAEQALQVVKEGTYLGGTVLKTDLYMPARMMGITWTARPLELVTEYLKTADDR